MANVLPWQIWDEAQPRTYPYGLWGFVILIIIGFIYLFTMWIIGILFYRTYKLYPQRKEYKYFSIGITAVALFDTIHVIGDVLFFIMNDSRVPISLGANTVFYFYPFATSLSVMGIFIFYILVYTYGVYKLGERKTFDYVFYLLGVLGIAFGLNPYNFWHMIKPEGVFDTKPITGTLLLIVGILAVMKFYVALKTKIIADLKKVPVGLKRIKLVTWGLTLMLILVILMVPHGILATIREPWALASMVIITILKLASLGSSAVLIYSGFVWPSWAERLFGR